MSFCKGLIWPDYGFVEFQFFKEIFMISRLKLFLSNLICRFLVSLKTMHFVKKIKQKFELKRLIQKLLIIPKILSLSIDTAKCSLILKENFNHGSRLVQDCHGNPIAWYTYPALEWIKQLDFSEKMVFEYGCGNSTLFWEARSKLVVSVEDNKNWHKIVSNRVKSNANLILASNRYDYVNSIMKYPLFDVIIIDGSYRNECAEKAMIRLSKGGIIILDNSDWCWRTSFLLRKSGLIQIDMAGFGPVNPYTWTTSIFLKRGFNIPSKTDRQPSMIIGSWDRDYLGEWEMTD